MTKLFIFVVTLFSALACSTVRYTPEIPEKPGVVMDHGTLVFSVPPDHPQDKMKLSFREIKGNRLRLHFRFLRKLLFDPKNPETMDPKDLTLQVEGEGTPLTPSEIYAASASRPVIKLTGENRQAIDVIYKLPMPKNEKAEFDFFILHWKLNYAAGKSEERTVRFDRHQTQPTYAVDYVDPDFGQYNDMDDAGWYPNGWGWW